MAGAANLKARSLAAPLAVIGAGVLVGHAFLIDWIWPQAAAASVKKMAQPVFARLLQPAPPAMAAPAAAALLSKPDAVPDAVAGAMTATVPLPAQVPQAMRPERTASSTVEEANAAAPVAAQVAEAPSSPAAPPPAAAASAAPSPVLDTWPADTRLSYRLEGQFRGGPLYGSARVQWQRQASGYQAQVQIDLTPFGQRSLTSQGEVTPRGLVPRAYEERTNTRRRALRLEDDQVVLADGRTLPRPADVQDAASQFVELGHRFATGKQALALGGSVPIWLARPGGVDRWTYDIVAQDLLKTPRLGDVMAWRLKPRPPAQRRDNLSAEIWFAPSLQYLPVRIRLTLGDEAEIDLLVDTIEQR